MHLNSYICKFNYAILINHIIITIEKMVSGYITIQMETIVSVVNTKKVRKRGNGQFGMLIAVEKKRHTGAITF